MNTVQDMLLWIFSCSSLTILLLLGGTVNPVVLVCCPDHLKLVEKDLELPRIGHKGVDVRGTITRPVPDQICGRTEKWFS